MHKTLSNIQKQYYHKLSGEKYVGTEHFGTFETDSPFEDKQHKGSSWIFTFVFDPETGYLICELSHRMTNNRVYGWDYEGNELSNDITTKYFKSDIEGLKIIKKK